MSSSLAQTSIQTPVEDLLSLFNQVPTLRAHYDTTAVKASLQKAISPTFEVVFAGAFSAGKSMLINALLGRELLYSAEGHATGTECKIAYAETDQERVVLTFASKAEIAEQANVLCQRLNIDSSLNISQDEVLDSLAKRCIDILVEEGGESKSERAKQASALKYLLEGFAANFEHIRPEDNNVCSMEQLGFTTLKDAAAYARRGINSAVLKRIEYYCTHPLLKDGNVLVDTPGIDAPVKRDAELTYAKIENPDTSAVICVLKPAAAGDMTSEETELLEKTQHNPGIRDRVFYVFNRVDESWYNTQLRQRLDQLIQEQFSKTDRIYRTSALLGFFGSRLKNEANEQNRFGLDTFLSKDGQGQDRQGISTEATPQFVSEFNRYCASSGKLSPNQFRIDVRSYESPNQNYVRILTEESTPLINQLISDSGIETFRQAITHYLTQEKRPQLLGALADDLHSICVALRQHYLQAWRDLEAQPQDIDAIKETELRQLGSDLKAIGDDLCTDIEAVVNEVVSSNANETFEKDFKRLQLAMVNHLDELLNLFSVAEVHRRAQASHKRNSVVPLSGILAEAFYYLANGLEDVLVAASQTIVSGFFQRLRIHVKQKDYYRSLFRLLGNDSGLEQMLHELEKQTLLAIKNEAVTECDRYVRERPEFYQEDTASIWQLRQTLQQACNGYDYHSMVDAEPAIRQLLKLDFEQKVKETITRTFRQTLNQTLNAHLLPAAAAQSKTILQQYEQAEAHLAKTLEREAEETLRKNALQKTDLEKSISIYNHSITAFNHCLESMQLDRQKLPLLQQLESKTTKSADSEVFESLKQQYSESDTHSLV
ncbi:MAG: dynamin-like GTPase family protein [Cyanobacteria bacterium P01_A01_bin.17]